MAPDLRRAETAGLARFTPLSKRLQMTNWVGCSTNRDVVPQSCTPTMDEQRRVLGLAWSHRPERRGLNPPLPPPRPPLCATVSFLSPSRSPALGLWCRPRDV